MVLNPTPADQLCDAEGHPYFLWDSSLTLAEFLPMLQDPDDRLRADAIGKLLRQARTDDALSLVTAREIEADWPLVERHLGKRRAFWAWLLPRLIANEE